MIPQLAPITTAYLSAPSDLGGILGSLHTTLKSRRVFFLELRLENIIKYNNAERNHMHGSDTWLYLSTPCNDACTRIAAVKKRDAGNAWNKLR